MRLTLRTLLAWLDDTLQPTQVREIGGQVSESPFAQELSERIHRVTRQRRLSVPSSSAQTQLTPMWSRATSIMTSIPRRSRNMKRSA